MSYGIRTWGADGTLRFDSTSDTTLMYYTDFDINGDTVAHASGAQVVYSYPALTGYKIVVFLESPYVSSTATPSSTPYGVLVARVTYPGGVPTVTVTGDVTDLGFYAGHMAVFYTGALQ